MYKIALVGFGVGILLAALAPANAIERAPLHHPRYEGRSVYVPPPPVYEGRSAFVPYRGGGCFVTTNPTDSIKGIRHWRPAC